MVPLFARRQHHRWLILLALVAAFFAVTAAQAQTFPKLTGRVVDDAHLLNQQQVEALTQLSQETEQASSRQLVIATVPDLQGYPIEDYGYKLGRAWAIGQKEIDNGIILLVAPNERKVRIEVGYGLEPIMTDALSNMIIRDDILPKFRDGDMAGGIIAGAQAIADQLKAPPDEAEQKVAAAAQSQQQAAHDDNGGVPWALIFWLIVIGFMIVSRFSHGGRGRRYRGGMWPIFLWGSGFGGGGSSGWGGGGGGSNWGGGGGFSGGGGSFGGGGASGSW
ncbi:TPM domain-containing protein [Hephaestia mangrovi]|uniref:TPM domain-containing protein n=1 Tax=Hephaestia mangrovi TaxID=2873268 RepID=UPI001CA7AEF0|nr:TPM domain-containing protein [Hephaestia mangrovi]MBY8828753.1 TPM domain-containing protein [Hephaestia mangrovi]